MKRHTVWSYMAILALVGMVMAGCAAPAPQVVEKVVTQQVEKQVVVTQQVEKQVVVTAAPAPTFDWKKYAGTTIRVLGPTHNFLLNTVKDLLPQFEADTGIKVLVEDFPEAQTWEKIGIELLAGNRDLDVIYYQPQRSGKQYVEAGWLELLEPYLSNPLLTPPGFGWPGDFFGGSILDSTIDGKLIAVPTDRDQAPLVFYNNEILEKYGVTPPTTLEELEAAAKKVMTDSNGEVYGITNRGKGAEITSQFAWVMNEFGATWEKDGKPTINTPEWIAAAEWWGRTLKDSGPPGSTNYTYREVVNDFQLGKVAFTLETALNPAFVNDRNVSLVAGKIGADVIPYGPAYANGDDSYRYSDPCKIASRFGLSINSKSEKKDAAWYFITYMTSQQAQLNYLLLGRPSARNSAWASPTFKTATSADSWYWTARIESASICYPSVGFAPPSIKNTAQARDIIGKVIQAGILGQDIKPLAAEAQIQLEKMLADQG